MRGALLRRPVIAWALCDWANSAFATTVMAGFLPGLLQAVLERRHGGCGQHRSGSASLSRLGSLVIALAAPLLGAMADRGGARVRLLAFFTLIGAAMTAALYFVDAGRLGCGGRRLFAGRRRLLGRHHLQ